VVRAAAALGSTSGNIESAADVIGLLMLQNGVQMTSDDGTAATFAQSNQKGLQAFNFYLEFANPASPSYTWNSTQVHSLDAFASGDVAMVLAYQSNLERIKKRSPFMNMRLAPAPQVEGGRSLSYPRYMGFAVSKKSKASEWGWDFVYYVTTTGEAQEAYSASTGHPPALRELVGRRVNDPASGVFARQALTARSWYQVDEREVQRAFNAAIEDVLSGRLDSRRALEQAQDQISKLMETTIRLQKRL
jgi:ABC-type glycerol-3-phosphate transport system substrate-binding protein